MSAYCRVRGAGRGRILASVVCLFGVSLIAGCADFKQMVGLDEPMPDEFAVESRAPLTIPPDFDLRPPAPGAPRPQEVSSANRAKTAIDNAGPGDPGKQAAGSVTSMRA